MSVFVVTHPTVPGENTIQPAADNVEGLLIEGHSPTQSAPIFQVSDSANNPLVSIIDPNGNVGFSGPPGGFLAIYDPTNGGIAGGSTALLVNPSGAGNPQVQIFSNNDNDPALTVNGNGNTQAASIFIVRKFGASKVFEVGPSGQIGFFGVTAVVRQTGASAAGIAAIIDPNAKAAIQALQTALANFGLVTSPA